MMNLLVTVSIVTSMITSTLTHPIALVAAIIFQATSICVLSFMLFKTPWFSYIVFLIFMGAIMVMFVYISSLASNENFLTNHKSLLYTSLVVGFVMLVMMDLSDSYNTLINLNMSALILKMYSNQMYSMMILTMSYLLFSLLIVVEIIKQYQGPLRLNF